MEQKSISRNYFYNLFYQVLTIVLPLITTPYLSRVLGAEPIGIYSYTLSIATYFVLFGSLGVALYGQREIAYLQDNKTKRSITFWEILIMKTITMTVSIITFGLTFARSGQYAVYYRILMIELFSQMIDISWFFQGMEEFKKTVTRNSIVKLLFVICIFLFVKSPADIYKYFFIITLSNLLGNLSLWLYLPKFVDKIDFKTLHIFKHLKQTLILFVPQIATQVYTVLDRTMIGSFCANKEEVGFYEQAQKVVKLLLTVVTSLGTVMVPRMANIFAKGDMEQLKKYLLKSFSFTFMLAFPIMTGICLVSKEFVPIFFGAGYDKVIILIQAISPIILFIGISNILGTQYLLPTKRQKEFTISVSCGAVINFILNFILINKINSIGASIATVIAELSVALIQLYFSRNLINFSDILKSMKNYVISTLAMTLVIILATIIFKFTGLASVIVKIFIGVIVYSLVLIILKDELVTYIKERIFNIYNSFRREKI
jgi:O-antigen/teichoic acid export membrane protein